MSGLGRDVIVLSQEQAERVAREIASSAGVRDSVSQILAKLLKYRRRLTDSVN